MKGLCVCILCCFCGKIIAQEEFYKQTRPFKEIGQYPKIKDEKAFIKALRKNVQYEEGGIPPRTETINYFKKVKLFGSEESFYLLEYDYHEGSTSGFPWKDQFLFTRQGKLIGQMHAIRVEVVKIFPGALPFLFVVSSTGHGNGWHNVFRIKNEKMVDALDHFLGNRPQTYATGAGIEVNMPNELHHLFTDVDKDGFNDIVFYGKMSYSGIAIPDATIPVKYVFQYHPKTGHFTEQEDYSKKYEYIFGDTKYGKR